MLLRVVVWSLLGKACTLSGTLKLWQAHTQKFSSVFDALHWQPQNRDANPCQRVSSTPESNVVAIHVPFWFMSNSLTQADKTNYFIPADPAS